MIRRIAAVLIMVALSGNALAQESIDKMGAAYARLVSFEAEPQIAAAHFNVESESPDSDDLAIWTAKLPYHREFGDSDQDLRWFIQVTGSYLTMDQELHLEVFPDFTVDLDANWEGFGAMMEGGLLFRLSESFVLAPSFGLGLTRLENDVNFSSQFIEDLLAPSLDGALYNWDTLASVIRASVALRYDQKYGDWRVKGSGHISGSYVDSFNESDRFSGFTDQAGSMGLKMDVSHPVGFNIRDYPAFVIGHVAYTSFIGANRDELGFTGFGEIGASLGVRKFSLGLMRVLGSDVAGWSILFNYDY